MQCLPLPKTETAPNKKGKVLRLTPLPLTQHILIWLIYITLFSALHECLLRVPLAVISQKHETSSLEQVKTETDFITAGHALTQPLL